MSAIRRPLRVGIAGLGVGSAMIICTLEKTQEAEVVDGAGIRREAFDALQARNEARVYTTRSSRLEQRSGKLMSCGFEVEDYAGRAIRLEHKNWEKHQPRHPEVAPYHDAIPRALAVPHLVVNLSDQRHYYRFGIGRGKLGNAALRVVVGRDNGIIRTVHFARRLDLRRGVVELDRLDEVKR